MAAGEETGEGSLGALEQALDEVLQAVDRGTTVDALYLQERYPGVWRQLAETLAFEGKLEGLAPARRRIGKFKLLRRLGSGGMGTVWLATGDDDPERRVALKVIHPHLARTGDFFRRFVREAQIGTRVVHPNVVRTLDALVIEQDGELLNVLVMEYEHGQTLRELLDEMGRVPEQLCRHVGREVARALSELHAKGIVHRDLKPENVLITPDEIVKLMDLGVARAVSDDGRISRSGAFVGSWLYAAPEQFRGDGVGFAADLYALGLVLHEMAAGIHPFEGEADFHVAMRRRLTERPRPVSDANPQVSPFFDEAVATLLHAESRARFESAARVAAVLGEGERSEWWRARERELRLARRAPLRRIRVPRDARLHGRGEELAVLDAVFESACAGEGRVAIVVGEAGIGKSRLTDAFVQRLLARRESLHFLYGSYPPGGVVPSDSAFLDAFRGFFGRDGLESALAPYFDGAPMLLEAAADWLRDSGSVDTRTVQSVISRLVRGLAAERPTVLVVEDLHFAPEAGRGLFTTIAHGAAASPLLVIGTTRPGTRGTWRAELERLPSVRRVAVERLEDADVRALMGDVLASATLAPSVADAVATTSDGNPFFITELVRGVRDGRFIARSGDPAWVVAEELGTLPVPESIREVVLARVDALDAAERDLLSAACCCGHEFDGALLGEALDLGRLPTLRSLAWIESRHRLVRSVGDHYRFDHHQVLETLRDSLPEPLARGLHEALGVALEARYDTDTPTGSATPAAASEICRHFANAGLVERTLPYLEQAFDHLAGSYRHRVAVNFAGQVLAVPSLPDADRLFVLVRRAHHLEALGERDRERADLEAALVLADAAGAPGPRGDVRSRLGEHLRAVARYEEAAAVLEEAVALAVEAGDRRLEGRAAGTLGGVRWNQGDYEVARPSMERCRNLARQTGDDWGEATANGHLGNLAFERGDPAEARRCFERRIELARRVGDRRGEAIATGNLAVLASMDGDVGRCLELHERNLLLSRELGYREGEAVALVNLGPTYLTLGDLDRAEELLLAARQLCRALDSSRIEVYALDGLGSLADQRGQPAQSVALFRESLALRDRIGLATGKGGVMGLIGAVLCDAGDEEGARDWLGRAAEEAESPDAQVFAAVHGARLPGGDVEAAVAAFEEHRGDLSPNARMEIQAQLHTITGDSARLAEARELLDRLVESAPPERRKALLENVRLHREIRAGA